MIHYFMHSQSFFIVATTFYWLIATASYYKFQIEIAVVTNQDFYIEIMRKA